MLLQPAVCVIQRAFLKNGVCGSSNPQLQFNFFYKSFISVCNWAHTESPDILYSCSWQQQCTCTEKWMRHLERPTSKSAFPQRVWSLKRDKDSKVGWRLLGLPSKSTFTHITQLSSVHRSLCSSCSTSLLWRFVDADRALPGGLAQTDGYTTGTFPSQVYVPNTMTKRQENTNVPPKAWHPALINQQTAGGHFSLQSYAWQVSLFKNYGLDPGITFIALPHVKQDFIACPHTA